MSITRNITLSLCVSGLLASHYILPAENANAPQAQNPSLVRVVISTICNTTAYLGTLYVAYKLFQKYEAAKGFEPKQETVRLQDIVGGAPEEVNRLISYLKDPKVRHQYWGANINPYKGVLLEGPPGNGKTLLARAIAGECGIPFKEAKCSELKSMLMGQTEKNIQALFAEARKLANDHPSGCSILFFDELDALGKKRTNNAFDPYTGQFLNTLLAEMDGFGNKHEEVTVIVIGATNLVATLDPALKRPGRFDKTITINNPNAAKRKKLIEFYLKKIGYKHPQESNIIRLAAEKTKGKSASHIAEYIQEAKRRAIQHQIALDDQIILDVIEGKPFRKPAKFLTRNQRLEIINRYFPDLAPQPSKSKQYSLGTPLAQAREALYAMDIPQQVMSDHEILVDTILTQETEKSLINACKEMQRLQRLNPGLNLLKLAEHVKTQRTAKKLVIQQQPSSKTMNDIQQKQKRILSVVLE